MSDGKDEILAALAKLDPKNDDHWTETGNPRLDALGFKDQPKRADVTAAAPLFTRSNTTLELPKAPAVVQSVEAAAKAIVDQDQSDYDALVKLCDEAEAAVQNAKVLAKQAQDYAHALEVKRDAALKRVEKARPKNENQLGIQRVLARAVQVRADKAGLAAELKSVGVTAKLLQKGSALDQAMQRKRGFGLQRPSLNGKVAAA
jgi:hypothetical protein